MSGQPQDDKLYLDMTSVEAITEAGGIVYDPAAIVNEGNTFRLRVNVNLSKLHAPALVGDAYGLFFHLERLEDGDRKTLAGGTHNVPSVGDWSQEAGPFTTGPGGDLDIPAGFESATYEITAHLHFQGGPATMAAAFNQTMIQVIESS